MDYPIYVLARLRLLSPCCRRLLLYNGGRFPSGEAIDRFLCPQCGWSYSLAEALAPRKGRRQGKPAQLALPLRQQRQPGAVEKSRS